ncbi:CRISPR-associated ring nuclease Crn3/Csx3 [Leptothoe sp. LEGE 181152]|nr:CRISPR-associated ring nuclease Crn3/Csx3 [Leptothoe sp. LEGE 181152]
MADASIQLTLSHHQTTQGLAYQLVTIELVSRDRIIEPQELATLRLPAGLDPRKGVVLSGRAPVWLYAYLVHECHPTVWVACFDPRLGAVVTTTHSKLVSVGQVLPLEDLNLGVPSIQPDKLGPALLVVGPPDSGKSVLSHQLFVTLVKDYPDVYLQRAQWDGEGNWTLELPENASEREAFKLANKGTLTERFFPYQGQAIRNLRQQKSLVIVDAGGMVQPEKQSILDACTHYLIISSKPEEIEPWHEFCGNQGNLQPIAVIHSTLEPTVEILQHEPFLELRCGPWVQGETAKMPGALIESMASLLR